MHNEDMSVSDRVYCRVHGITQGIEVTCPHCKHVYRNYSQLWAAYCLGGARLNCESCDMGFDVGVGKNCRVVEVNSYENSNV